MTGTKELVPISNLKSQIATSSLEPARPIEQMIYTLRDVQVILDEDIANLYGVKTKRLNEQVNRNYSRFPKEFRFQLNKDEFDNLRSQNATANWSKRRSLPYAFTEHGVIMAAAILKSEIADMASVTIVKAFVAMRRFLVANAQVFQRLDRIEIKQLETEHKIEQVFEKLEERVITPKQGIFFDGQIYDAYEFICDLIKSAKTRIVLIDNYVDDTVLTMLDKREAGISATIYTQKISPQFQLDIAKHNAQYPAIDVKEFKKSHDRFLIIDDSVYLIGASLKDAGKKWFGVTKMEAVDTERLISKLEADSQ